MTGTSLPITALALLFPLSFQIWLTQITYHRIIPTCDTMQHTAKVFSLCIQNTIIEIKLKWTLWSKRIKRQRVLIQWKESSLWIGTVDLRKCVLKLYCTYCDKVKTPRERHLGRNLASLCQGICVPLGYCQESSQWAKA